MEREAALADFDTARKEWEDAFARVPDGALAYLKPGDDYAQGAGRLWRGPGSVSDLSRGHPRLAARPLPRACRPERGPHRGMEYRYGRRLIHSSVEYFDSTNRCARLSSSSLSSTERARNSRSK